MLIGTDHSRIDVRMIGGEYNSSISADVSIAFLSEWPISKSNAPLQAFYTKGFRVVMSVLGGKSLVPQSVTFLDA